MIALIKVHTKASEQKVAPKELPTPTNFVKFPIDATYDVYLRASPHDNQANIELIKLLKKHFKTKAVHLVAGTKSRWKIVSIGETVK